jgi:hypothetical protein
MTNLDSSAARARVVECTVEERPFRAAFKAVMIKGFSPGERVSEG